MKKKHDKTELLKIGDKLFRQQGFINTGTDQLLKEAEFPRSSFYYHFKDKEGFGAVTLDYYGDSVANYISTFTLDDEEKSPISKLKNYFYRICDYNEQVSYNNCCLVQRFAIEVADSSEVLKNTSYKQLQKWVQIIIPVIEEGQRLNEIRADLSSQEVAEFLFNSIYGATTLARIASNKNEMKKKMELTFTLIKG